MMKAKSKIGGGGGAGHSASRGGALSARAGRVIEGEAERMIERDLAAGKLDAMSYGELEEYVAGVREETGCEPVDDAWDLQMARDGRLGRFKEMEDRALQDLREGRVLPVPGEFGERGERKIDRDAAAGKFDGMSGAEMGEYVAEIRAEEAGELTFF